MSEPFVGEIRLFGNNYAPKGWMLCEGQILPINQNQALYALLGNVYGGNGKDERPVGEICTPGTKVEINGRRNASFCTPAFVKRTFHGDQWVTAEIEVRNGTVKHFVKTSTTC